ncbi:MAG TPA: hypothetical protein VKE70_07035 [Candidatus Solibacter sp.]|nr:hypothetical protein [Candidatus Solibacter sp.]
MQNRQRVLDLIISMVSKRAQYVRLTEAYNDVLHKAHQLPHGSHELKAALTAANALGPELDEALARYQEVIRSLRAFYQEHSHSAAHR